MSNLEELIDSLNRMDDNPGWRSGDRMLVCQLCRCVVELAEEVKMLKKWEANRSAEEMKFKIAGGIEPVLVCKGATEPKGASDE